MKEVILDIGGEGNFFRRRSLSALPVHPRWGSAIWLTLNIEPQKAPDIIGDATTLANIRSECVHGIYSAHTIEHLPPDAGTLMFGHWLRVLRPGGRVEIRCPDIEWAWQEYFSGRLPESLLTELMLGIRTGPYEVHRNMWWASKLIAELTACGFMAARRIDYGFTQPYIDHWPYDGKHEEYHGFRVLDLLVEAYKPPSNAESSPALARQTAIERSRASNNYQGVRRYLSRLLQPIKNRRDERMIRALLDDIRIG